MVDFNDRRSGHKASPGFGVVPAENRGKYTADYRKGWRHSETAATPNLNRSTGTAWEDGYMDHAVGRPKYALRGHRFGTGDPVEGY